VSRRVIKIQKNKLNGICKGSVLLHLLYHKNRGYVQPGARLLHTSPGIHMRNWQPHPPPWFLWRVAVEFPKSERGIPRNWVAVMGKNMVNHLIWMYPIFNRTWMSTLSHEWLGVGHQECLILMINTRNARKHWYNATCSNWVSPNKTERLVNPSGRWGPFCIGALLTLKKTYGEF